jgi:hypothetical protein
MLRDVILSSIRKKRLLDKLADLLRRNRNFYPKSSLLSSFSATENAHFFYLDLARKL